MAKALTVAAYLLAASLAYASSCPVMLVSGMRDVDGIVVTFRNAGKLPIRDLEFNCSLARAAQPAQRMACREKNALFYPGMEYTLRSPASWYGAGNGVGEERDAIGRLCLQAVQRAILPHTQDLSWTNQEIICLDE